jgi:2-polyprenyl-3-methyl-5-hydroxy-6-metoxy-1,4-benzoquinol methylase
MTTFNPVKMIQNSIKEYKYFTKRPWTLKQVGRFWDTVDDYDDFNKKLYPYYKRFTNSRELFYKHYKSKTKLRLEILDIQTRSGVGALFWSKIFKKSNFTCVDFSENLLKKAKIRLKNKKNFSFKKVLNENFSLKKKYDIIFCYETVEHVFNFQRFIKSLKNHLKKDGYLIITCPNVSWEIIHWLTAIIEFNHSEGPHRFIGLNKLQKTFTKLDLKILNYNSTILIPFSNKFLISLDKFLTRKLPASINKLIMLRHTFILKNK